MIFWMSCSSACLRSPSAGSPSSRSSVSSGSTPPLNRARGWRRAGPASSVLLVQPYGSPKPLESSRSDSFDTSSSMSSSSSRFGSTSCSVFHGRLRVPVQRTDDGGPAGLNRSAVIPSELARSLNRQSSFHQSSFSVVVFFLPLGIAAARRATAPRAWVSAWGPARRPIAALVAAADPSGAQRPSSTKSTAAARRAGALASCRRSGPTRAGPGRCRAPEHLVGARHVAQRQRAAEVEPLDVRVVSTPSNIPGTRCRPPSGSVRAPPPRRPAARLRTRARTCR